jgi:hypothetical protein
MISARERWIAAAARFHPSIDGVTQLSSISATYGRLPGLQFCETSSTIVPDTVRKIYWRAKQSARHSPTTILAVLRGERSELLGFHKPGGTSSVGRTWIFEEIPEHQAELARTITSYLVRDTSKSAV